jgi:hypothetical protein
MPKPARGDKLGDVRVTGAAPILVIGTTGDPATPYAGAETMVSRIAGAGLLTFESTEHTAYGSGRSTCIDDKRWRAETVPELALVHHVDRALQGEAAAQLVEGHRVAARAARDRTRYPPRDARRRSDRRRARRRPA